AKRWKLYSAGKNAWYECQAIPLWCGRRERHCGTGFGLRLAAARGPSPGGHRRDLRRTVMPEPSIQTVTSTHASTGIAGLDHVLHGGLPRGHLYLVEGDPGSGKTTLGMQFLLDGRDRGESTLYVTLSETTDELRAAAGSHGWSLDGVEIHEFTAEESLTQ